MTSTHVTLLFLLRESEILLAMKKRGFGAGKWNAPGGKLEPGETPEQGAIRECIEEVGVMARDLQKIGELDFIMKHEPKFNHYAHIFFTKNWDGEPHETEEMRPQWFAHQDIPYDTMWPDDKLWIPLMLEGKTFRGSFTTDRDDQIVSYDIEKG